MQRLHRAGVSPTLIILGFRHYRVGRTYFGDTVATAARALGIAALDLEREVVTACTNPKNCAAIVDQLLRFHELLDLHAAELQRGPGLIPTVAALDRWWRSVGYKRGFPLPSAVHQGWRRVLLQLRAHGATALQLQHACSAYQLTVDGEALPPLEVVAANETVAAVVEAPPDQVEFLVLNGLRGDPGDFADARLLMDQVSSWLQNLPDVSQVQRQQRKGLGGETFVPARGTTELAPLWEAFPEPPTSMRWRMGPGEDLRDTWLRFWSQTPSAARSDYLSRHPPPEEWKRWISFVETNYPPAG